MLCHACEYRHLLTNCKYGDSCIRRNDSVCYILILNEYSSPFEKDADKSHSYTANVLSRNQRSHHLSQILH